MHYMSKVLQDLIMVIFIYYYL